MTGREACVMLCVLFAAVLFEEAFVGGFHVGGVAVDEALLEVVHQAGVHELHAVAAAHFHE